jgi:hypothetical protein
MPNKSYPSESSLCLSRRRRVLGLLVVAAVLALAPTSVARPDAAAAYGVPASVAADCSVDVTRALLSWFSSVPNGSVLSFGRGACYRIEGTLELRGRRGLTFEGNGATFRSLTAPDDQRALWRVVDSSRIAFHNLSIVGSYATGGKFDANLQHAHGIDLRGTAAEIAGVSISDVAGDGVYFGRGWSSALNRSSGSVHDSRIARVGRNAISITAGNDIRVERVNASAIGFIAFDVEPNIGAGWGSRRVTFDNNQIGAYYLYAYAIVQNAPISDQAFTNNTVSGRGLRIGITNPFTRTFRPANVTISGNRAASPQRAPALEILNVDGLTVTANTIPLSGGRMATIDNTCNATVSGNSYPGGILEALITRPRSDCGRRGRARRVRRSAHAAPATAARAALTIQASSPSPRP